MNLHRARNDISIIQLQGRNLPQRHYSTCVPNFIDSSSSSSSNSSSIVANMRLWRKERTCLYCHPFSDMCLSVIKVFTLWILLLISDGLTMSDEKRLIKFLLTNYARVGIVGRPVFNTSETVHVTYGISLIQILDLDEKNQVLTTNVWCRYTWNDILLRWDPNEFGGVKEIRVPSAQIWTPDIVLYNYADTRLEEHREALVVVQNTGDIMWIPMAIFSSTCSIDIRYFPFDSQHCNMKFGSWSYDGNKLDIDFYNNEDAIDIRDYVPSNEWVLLEHPAKKTVLYYPCCPEPFPDLTFSVKVKRLAIFYSFILVIPCVLLSFLTLVIFWLPPESPAKMLLGMNIFVAFFLLLRILADSTPPASSSVPLLGAYFCLNMVLITLSSFLSVVIINIYHRADKKNRVPPWLRRVCVDQLSRTFCMDYEHLRTPRNRSIDHVTHMVGDENSSGSHRRSERKRKKIKSPVLSYNKWEAPPNQCPRDSPIATRSQRICDDPDRSPVHAQMYEGEVREVKRALRAFMGRIHDRDVQNKVALEWRIVALVIDRVFFFIYLSTIIVSLATIFPWKEVFDTTPGIRQLRAGR